MNHRSKTQTTLLVGIGLVLTTLLPGCATRREQLERVAKDWCETIRASQVIPVYPPTADLLPGDMFLVDRPVREQQSEWDEKGFLSLPFELPRMGASELPSLGARYGSGRWAMFEDGVDPEQDSDGSPPESPPGDESGDGSDSGEESQPDAEVPSEIRRAPTAAFPSYSFRVSNGGSFDLAVPVQGVPVGLSFIGASGASGTITMKEIQTFGYDKYALMKSVRSYWADPDRKQYLKDLAYASYGTPSYIRVVSRVYGVKSFNVSLNASRSGGAGLDAGAVAGSGEESGNGNADTGTGDGAAAEAERSASQTDEAGNPIANKAPQDADRAASARLTELNARLAERQDTDFGVSARFVSASSRSVSLIENFDEPLVVGYLGFDLPISSEGELGVPVPTFNVLERGDSRVAFVGALTAGQAAFDRARDLAIKNGVAEWVFPAVADKLGYQAAQAYRVAERERYSLKSRIGEVAEVVAPSTQAGTGRNESALHRLAGLIIDEMMKDPPEAEEQPNATSEQSADNTQESE